MTRTAQTVPKVQLARCFFHKSDGSRCRRLVTDTLFHFCSSHLHVNPSPTLRPAIVQENQPVDVDLSTELGVTSPGEFKSLEEIYDFLCKLTYLLAANRISSRRAAILAYITSQAVRTSCAIQKLDADQNARPPEIVIDVARPRRDPSEPYENFLPPAESSTQPS